MWTLIYNGKLANQIAQLLAIVVKCYSHVRTVHFSHKLRLTVNIGDAIVAY